MCGAHGRLIYPRRRIVKQEKRRGVGCIQLSAYLKMSCSLSGITGRVAAEGGEVGGCTRYTGMGVRFLLRRLRTTKNQMKKMMRNQGMSGTKIDRRRVR